MAFRATTRSRNRPDKGHGRIETRTAALTTDIAWLQESHGWPGLAAIGKITASCEINGKTTVETLCYLLSQAFAPERFNAIVRSHWGIENGLHWVLDVVMDEDQARNRKDNGPQNLALLRKLALNLAKLEPSKGSMRGKLKQAGWDNTFLTKILLQLANIQMQYPWRPPSGLSHMEIPRHRSPRDISCAPEFVAGPLNRIGNKTESNWERSFCRRGDRCAKNPGRGHFFPYAIALRPPSGPLVKPPVAG
jgi:predicted transposase YbfD/YdcC